MANETQQHIPGEGGWTPSKLVPVFGACFGGAVTGVGTYLATVGPDHPASQAAIIGAALVGCGTGILGFFGIKSAGVRNVG